MPALWLYIPAFWDHMSKCIFTDSFYIVWSCKEKTNQTINLSKWQPRENYRMSEQYYGMWNMKMNKYLNAFSNMPMIWYYVIIWSLGAAGIKKEKNIISTYDRTYVDLWWHEGRGGCRRVKDFYLSWFWNIHMFISHVHMWVFLTCYTENILFKNLNNCFL